MKGALSYIKTFGIIISPTHPQLQKDLRRDGYICVPLSGMFNGRRVNSLIVFNINIENFRYFVEKYHQNSFFYCKVTNDGASVETSYYRIHDYTCPYDRKTNPYQLLEETTKLLVFGKESDIEIGEKFKCMFPTTCFGHVEETLAANLSKHFPDQIPANVIDTGMNSTGYHALSIRHRLNDGIQ